MRSLLFVPADSERKLARAPHSGADALILDLEDSVVPANRTLARRQARDFLVSTTAGGLRRYIRINPLSSGAALDDLAAVVPGNPDGILLPKCLPEDLRTLDHYLAALEVATSVSCGTQAPARSRSTAGWSTSPISHWRADCSAWNPSEGILAVDLKFVYKYLR